jgi:glycosyltransferase involved in cell wall biosynthesis
MKLAIVIPAYNEATTIRDVAVRALAHAQQVIVVDDGSVDGTSACIGDLPLTLVRHPVNQGKASSLWDGFVVALEGAADLVVTLDADGQHRPEDVPRLVAASQQYPHRLIVAARLRERASAPRARRIGNAIADFWLSWAAGHPIVDSQSGQRAYSAALLRAVMQRGVRHDALASFTLESELLIVAAALGYETVAVPIASVYFAGRVSHFRPARDVTRIVRMVAGHLLAARMAPRGLWRWLTQAPQVLAAAAEGERTVPGASRLRRG